MQVHGMLKAQLSAYGLRGAVLGFDAAAMGREMQASADALLEGFVEMQVAYLVPSISGAPRPTLLLQRYFPSPTFACAFGSHSLPRFPTPSLTCFPIHILPSLPSLRSSLTYPLPIALPSNSSP